MLFRGGLFGIAMLQAIGAKPTVFCFYYLCSISDDALTKRTYTLRYGLAHFRNAPNLTY